MILRRQARSRSTTRATSEPRSTLPRPADAASAAGRTQPAGILVTSSRSYFEIYGQLRYEQHVIRERSVVYRKDQSRPVQVLRRERLPPDAGMSRRRRIPRTRDCPRRPELRVRRFPAATV